MTVQVPNSAMVIMAHPDDPEFFCGGTIAIWCAAGCEVTYLILTNGNKGSDDPEMTPERLAAIRRKEQQAAADVLGVKRVLYLEEPDGELQPTLDLRKRVVAEIRRYKPEVIIAPDPTRYFYTDYINHADHRAAGVVAIDAVFPAARNRMYHPELLDEGLEPHTVRQVYLVGPAQPDRWVDITPVFETKLRAIRCHVSQIKDVDYMESRVRQRHQAVDEYGREVMREGFRILTIG
ncbi:MAG: PIG-L family deacetylase [Chloroflexi bacterium]|nr:MAG: PIG-L family deacetylase [Chloroflexota bacterium]